MLNEMIIKEIIFEIKTFSFSLEVHFPCSMLL